MKVKSESEVAQSRPTLCDPMDCSLSGSSVIKSASLVAQAVKRLSSMQETWVRSLDREDPLEKEMAIHYSTIAWKIPWTEETGRLQSTGLQRVGHTERLHFHLHRIMITGLYD